eukprot:TRINITY_DN48632_c0_g1_i1.p1 TRINITY_DN48632_c0_g1~~TRINITY_DN48632_c0_g1_i1.p1  ORF type:complete len:557 (+),score=147.30 TRINITY_DN48632_c0_g1_i1:78-1673(+)
MAAAVDFCPPSVMEAPATGQAIEFTCAACAQTFSSVTEQRQHAKSERHVYNTKRKLAGLKPISQEAWERKLKESKAVAGGANKGTAHLKAGKAQKKGSEAAQSGGYPSEASSGLPEAPANEAAATNKQEIEEDLVFDPCQSLFDRRKFKDVEENLRYMWKTYNFYVPDREYCTNLEGLLEFLFRKINEECVCIYCNRRFPDPASVRRHMLDMKHTRIGTEARTRRGNPDEMASEDCEAELEEFFDFTGSTREITEKITDPATKIGAILRFFDKDRDDFLGFKDLQLLWKATNGDDSPELSEALYNGACAQTGANPKKGLDEESLALLYAEGFADLQQHWTVLQDKLTEKFSARKVKKSKKKDESKDEDANEEDEDDEDDEDDSDAESSSTEIVECDDEAEFEEVMRVLGMEPASITDDGDLRLPNGMIAGSRDLAYVWKQRGTRMGQNQLALGGGACPGGRRIKAQLMLSNNGDNSVLLSHRQKVREGKRIIAILKSKQKYEMKLGMSQNIIQKGKPQKYRTITGDASGGR